MTDVARISSGANHRSVLFYCPGCKCLHAATIRVGDHHPSWEWNGSLEAPTLQPSLLMRTGRAVDPSFVSEPGDPPEICHIFVTNGQIQFLADSTHELAGQTVGMLSTERWFEDEPS